MVSSTTIVAGNLAWCVPLVVVLIYLTKRLATNKRFVACQVPLLSEDNLVDHRIDAAKREAEHGYLSCTVCGFENFTRSHHCAICGAKCFDTGEDDEDAVVHMLLSPSRELTPLQRRAREWARKLDLQGRLFWYRNAMDDNRHGSLFPGYTVRFREEPESVEVHEKELTEKSVAEINLREGNDSKETSIEIPAAQAETLETNKPGFDVSTLTYEVVDAAHTVFDDEGEAESSPDSTALDETRKHEVEISEKDFPAKFAHFVTSAAVLLVPASIKHLKLSVHRAYVLEESMELLSCIQVEHVRAAMRINFLEESGVDAGGLHREWLMLLNDMLFSPELGLFKCTSRQDQTYFINPTSQYDNGDDHLIYFYGTGRLVGRALLDGAVLHSNFCVPLLKLILGVPVGFSDLEYYDAQLYSNLVWMLENDNVEVLGLDFSVSEQVGDQVVVTELVPRGREIPVTDANKYEYLDRRFRHLIIDSVAPQLSVFLKGIYEVIPHQLLKLFDYEELNYLLCGTGEIDVDDWERHTRISMNLEDNKRVVKWFWEIVRAMSGEYRCRLLQFATGCSRVPIVGFKGLTSYDGRLCLFTLKGVAFENEGYIRSHACFNMLELPLYKTKKAMQTILDAILEDVVGFTTV
uniref:HECT-type E3 ubiquitin transferase n=1 Tax=Globisporangium ultimum (strain ATCC 200006 / CBS 805.95 / DAOM BR144) TaxID=431595 RepID=K3WL09_GLOUD